MEQKYYLVTKYGYIIRFTERGQTEVYLKRNGLTRKVYDHFPTEDEYYAECEAMVD